MIKIKKTPKILNNCFTHLIFLLISIAFFLSFSVPFCPLSVLAVTFIKGRVWTPYAWKRQRKRSNALIPPTLCQTTHPNFLDVSEMGRKWGGWGGDGEEMRKWGDGYVLGTTLVRTFEISWEIKTDDLNSLPRSQEITRPTDLFSAYCTWIWFWI